MIWMAENSQTLRPVFIKVVIIVRIHTLNNMRMGQPVMEYRTTLQQHRARNDESTETTAGRRGV